MAGVLEVWIAQPENLCAVDDGKWTLGIYDTKLEPLVWEDRQFVALQAHHGHWSGPVPPGHYVVRAQRRDDQSKLRTHPALVQVACEGIVCLHLFADAPDCEKPQGQGERGEPRTQRPRRAAGAE